MSEEATQQAAEKAQPITITMSDGRQQTFSPKGKVVTEILGENDAVRIDLRNGQTLTVETTVGGLINRLACHGITQKFRDEIAGEENLDDAYEGLVELLERLKRGEWNEKREGGQGLSGASTLARAIAELKGKPIGEIRTWLSGLNHKQKLALRALPQVAEICRRIESEKASAGDGVDGSALLDMA